MNPKQEALKVIREQVGDSSISYNTTITRLTEEHDTDILALAERLERELGIELSEELLVDVETVGELCQLASRGDEDG